MEQTFASSLRAKVEQSQLDNQANSKANQDAGQYPPTDADIFRFRKTRIKLIGKKKKFKVNAIYQKRNKSEQKENESPSARTN